MSIDPTKTKNQLLAATRVKDQAKRGRALFAGLALCGVVVLGTAAADYWISLPGPVRWLTLLTALLAAGFAGWQLVSVWRRPTSLKEVSLDVEASEPTAGCEVSTAAEYLAGDRKIAREYEQDLVDALEARAARVVDQRPPHYIRNFLLPAAIAAGVVAFCGLLFLVVLPGSRTALVRATAPWSDASFTRIIVQPGSVEVPIGTELNLTNRFSGRVPKLADFEWREEGRTDWNRLRFDIGTNREALLVHHISTSMVYRVVAGDSTSPTFTVSAYVPPAVKDLGIRLTPPAYTRIKTSEQKAPGIVIVRGTDARVQMEPNVQLGTARLRFTNAAPVDLKPGTNGLWATTLTITNDTEYWFELADTKGRPGLPPEHFHIRALPDEAPKVDFTKPGEDIRAKSEDSIPMEISATDDFGVDLVRVVYHKLGEPEKSLAVTNLTAKPGGVDGQVELALAGLKLQDFDVVTYRAEAIDNNNYDGPGLGKSPTYFIEINNREPAGSLPKDAKQGKQSPKVNLLAIEKQIIADTGELGPKDKAEKYKELAQRQRDALEFGKMYQDKLGQMGAPMLAQAEMNQAVDKMRSAAKKLEKSDQPGALPPEEDALASMYRAIKAMPELQNLPTKAPPKDGQPQPPSKIVDVVMEEIKKQKKEDPKTLEELKQALADAQALAQAQSNLMEAAQDGSKKPGEAKTPPKERPTKPNTAKGEQAQKAQSAQTGEKGDKGQDGKSGEDGQKGEQAQNGKPGEKAEKGQGKEGQKGQGKSQEQAQAQGQGEGQGEGPGKGRGQPSEQKPNGEQAKKSPEQKGEPAKQQPKDQQAKPPTPEELKEMAAQQEKISEQTKELADRLARLAGKDMRVSKGIGQRVANAAQNMKQAAQGMRQGSGTAIESGTQGGAGLNSAAAALERIIEDKPELSDVTAEDAPKQYESAISDYFKRLSRAE